MRLLRRVTQILGSLTVHICPEMTGVTRAQAGAVMRPEKQRSEVRRVMRDAYLDSNLLRCLMTSTMVVVTQPRTRITAKMAPMRITITVSPSPASPPSLSPCRL